MLSRRVLVLVICARFGGFALAAARRSDYPWLVAMVAYTMLSLWLLAQPLVKERAQEPTQPAAQSVISRA